MAIKLKSLERISKTYSDQGYVFKDINFDLAFSEIENPGVKLPIPGNDIKASFDLGAIRNSLQNLFNTIPGQRFLFPEYGTDLYQYIFLPITDSTGDAIRNKIIRSIQTFERRVTILEVNVTPDTDNNKYDITIVLQIPIFRNTTTLNGELNIKSQSFIFLPTTRNT